MQSQQYEDDKYLHDPGNFLLLSLKEVYVKGLQCNYIAGKRKKGEPFQIDKLPPVWKPQTFSWCVFIYFHMIP